MPLALLCAADGIPREDPCVGSCNFASGIMILKMWIHFHRMLDRRDGICGSEWL